MSTIAKTVLSERPQPRPVSRSAEGVRTGGPLWNGFVRAIKPLASLRLTVVLLALSMILIFAGTWAQIDADAFVVQKKYFHSFFTWISAQLFLPRPKPGQPGIRGAVPFPGGYTLIFLLLINLFAAHTIRFKLGWKRVGIFLIHAGLVLLISGEVVTSLFATESQMHIDEGTYANYSMDIRTVELAVTDPSPADHDNVVVVPAGRLEHKGTVELPNVPFTIRLDKYFPNAHVLGPAQAREKNVETATFNGNKDFDGMQLGAEELPLVKGTEDAGVNQPAAYVTVLSKDGKELGHYLLSAGMGPTSDSQTVTVDGHDYKLGLRFKRMYQPFTIHLLKFTHDVYTGTDIPKNFASRVRLVDPARHEDREVSLWMNHPLRYAGETFYQSGFKKPEDNGGRNGTILQVVRNPGWVMPYVSCTIVAIGMLIHFGMLLVRFLRRRAAAIEAERASAAAAAVPPPTSKKGGKSNRGPRELAPALAYETVVPLWKRPAVMVPAVVTAIAGIWLLTLGKAPEQSGEFNLNAFSALPIVYGGRPVPLDSVARNSLRLMNARETTATADGKSVPAIQWLADSLSGRAIARDYRIFRIDHPDIVSMLNLDASRTRFSIGDIAPKWQVLADQDKAAREGDKEHLTDVQKKILELGQRVHLAITLSPEGLGDLFLAPPTSPGQDWKRLSEIAAEVHATGQVNPGARMMAEAIQAYEQQDPKTFNDTVARYQSWLDANLPDTMRKVHLEVLFNRFDPFYHCMLLYVGVFVLAAGAWLGYSGVVAQISGWSRTLTRTAFGLLLVTFAAHTLGLVARIYIQGRPPVTNLYSTAIFIPWGVAALCIGLERIYRNALASAVAAAFAAPSLILALHLAMDPTLTPTGDTMEMLRAVLDTNFWLATHVVTINLGYSATFLAGFLAIAYVLLGIFTSELTGQRRVALVRMTYAIVCFAMFFSFVGTILGGIWADQSWGRFWGWDPKENGAALIVLWNAIVLHARWGGIVRERGVMLLAIFGNAVTAWSYFGTNMLGVGLHSYGFMGAAIPWLAGFECLQLFLIALGSIPLQHWRSYRAEGANAA